MTMPDIDSVALVTEVETSQEYEVCGSVVLYMHTCNTIIPEYLGANTS